MELKSFILFFQACSFFNSNAVPLKLALTNADPLGEEINVMFKVLSNRLTRHPPPERCAPWWLERL